MTPPKSNDLGLTSFSTIPFLAVAPEGVSYALYANSSGGCTPIVTRYNFKGKYILLEKDGWQVADLQGRIISDILPTIDFPNTEHFFEPFFVYKHKDKYGFFCLGGAIYEAPIYDKITRLNAETLKIEKEGKYAIHHFQDKSSITPLWDDMRNIEYTPFMAVKKQGGWQLYNRQPIHSDLVVDSIIGIKSWETAIVKKDNKFGFINKNMELIVPFIYDSLKVMGIQYMERDIWVKEGDQWKKVDGNGKEIILPNNAPPITRYKGNPIEKKQDKYGVMKPDGNVLIPFDYEALTPLLDYLQAKKGTNWGILSDTNTVFAPFEYDSFIVGDDKNIIAEKQGKYGILNTANPKNTVVEYEKIERIGNKEYQVQKQGKWGVINTKNQIILPVVYDSLNYRLYIENVSEQQKHIPHLYIPEKGDSTMNICYFVAKKDGKWGLVSNDNKIYLPFEYDKIDINNSQNTVGIIILKKGGKWGVITHKNKVIIPFDYEEIMNSVYLPVVFLRKNGKIGVATWEHQLLIPFEYDKYELHSVGNDIKLFSLFKANQRYFFKFTGEYLGKSQDTNY